MAKARFKNTAGNGLNKQASIVKIKERYNKATQVAEEMTLEDLQKCVDTKKYMGKNFSKTDHSAFMYALVIKKMKAVQDKKEAASAPENIINENQIVNQ